MLRSASKFWPFGAGTRKDGPPPVPATAAAARILAPSVRPGRPDLVEETSFGTVLPTSPLDSSPAVEAQPEPAPVQRRGAERFVPRRTAVTVTDSQGKKHNARIINVSATAAAVEVSPALDPLGITHLGLTPVSTGRRITSGVVLVFVKPISPSRCNEAVTF